MKKEELEQKVETLRTMVQESQVNTSNYTGKLADVEKELANINKPALTPLQFDSLYEAVEKGVGEYDFSDSDNFDKEFGIDYDGKVTLESFDINNSQELVEAITEEINKLFTEATCPEDESFLNEDDSGRTEGVFTS